MSDRHDVIVVGGGPAGLAAASCCAQKGLSVALFERRSPTDFRVGETLGAEVGALLRELGAFAAVEPHLAAEEACPIMRSAWGSSRIEERPSIQHPLGAGWHVNRVRFDGALTAWARSCGVQVHEDTGTCVVTRDDDGFTVRPRRGPPAWGRRLLDASGRGAPATSLLGERRWLAVDRQVAILARLAPAGVIDAGGDSPAQSVDLGSGLLLEAVEEGYWYSAPMADGALIVVLVTDSDVLLSLGPDRMARFQRAFERSLHTAARARGLVMAGRPRVFRSDSGRLIPDRGPGFRAVGDASMATDPLGGNGVARALRSAVDAAESLDAPFDRALAERRFSDYLDQRASYYLLEPRWPKAPFWARRRPVDPGGAPLLWREVSLTLPPDMVLCWAADPDPSAEAWLPPAALGALRAMLATPQPAHRLLLGLREIAPLGDRRLLVALEWLLAAGALAAR